MSKREKKPEGLVKSDFGTSEGWEALVENSPEGSFAANPELEEAMREAADSADRLAADSADRRAAEKKPTPPASSQAPTPAPTQAPDEELVLSNPIERSAQEEALRLQVELTDANDRLLRLHADFQNFRKRAAREHQEALQFSAQNLVKDLLSVVDNLERAIDHARQSEGGDLQGVLQGVELVQRELTGVLETHHVTSIDALGLPFNPSFHEAMAQVAEDAVEPNTVIEVLQKGYQLRDRLLRPAQVVVTKGGEGSGGEGQGEATE